jgi:uncharacterized protein with HEPN domain
MRDDLERIQDVLEAIEHIQKYTSRGREAFDGDELVQTWVVYHIQVIGEAIRSLSDDLRSHHPEIPWSDIIGMRNILVHGYFHINRKEVWATVEDNLPTLKSQAQQILQELRATDEDA